MLCSALYEMDMALTFLGPEGVKQIVRLYKLVSRSVEERQRPKCQVMGFSALAPCNMSCWRKTYPRYAFELLYWKLMACHARFLLKRFKLKKKGLKCSAKLFEN